MPTRRKVAYKSNKENVSNNCEIKSDNNLAVLQRKTNNLKENNITLAGYCAVCWKNASYFCNFCLFVGYCCFSHMASHWQQHQAFCAVVNKQLTRNEGLFYGHKPQSPDLWRFLRIQALENVKHLLKRNVISYERDLILFPKCCASCYETRCDKLQPCKNCHQIWYCQNNPDHLPKSHLNWCKNLQLFSSLVRKQAEGNLFTFDMNFGALQTNSSIFHKCTNIKSVICKILQNVGEVDNLDECKIAMIAQAASGPLTILHALKVINYKMKKNFVIHFIGAELHYEGRTLKAWESFFMHFLPQMINLKVVMVGPELSATCDKEQLQLCEDCKIKKKSCKFEYKDGLLYHEYIYSKKFPKPNLVGAFNPGLHRATGFNQIDTWPQTIKTALSHNCPFIITAYTSFEAPLDLKRVLEHSKVNIIQSPKINPFASLKPDRNFISDDEAPLIFKNYYMSIVASA